MDMSVSMGVGVGDTLSFLSLPANAGVCMRVCVEGMDMSVSVGVGVGDALGGFSAQRGWTCL